MQQRRVDAGGLSFAISEAGSGDRHLLLVHGFTGAKEDFGEVLDRLADAGWHAVAPDLRGHGSSDQPADEGAYDLERFADDVWALAEALGWDHFVLLGLSLGGMIAQIAALRDPGRLDGLVLMDTTHGPLEGIDAGDLELGVSIVREHGMAALEELQSTREDPLASAASLRLRAERPGWAEYERRKFLSSSAAMWVAVVSQMVSQVDRLDRLTTLPPSLPVLVIVGEQDKAFLGPSERMAKAVPGARLAVVADAGHAPHFENTDAWWDALTAFLKEVP
jgi:pimeloyl-ACP methyl ester carboxylesterase